MMNEEIIPITPTSLILAAQRGVLGEIRPKMRDVTVSYNDKTQTIALYIFYDEPLTEEEKDYDISGIILTEIISSFPQATRLNWEEHEIVLPYPERIPHKGYCIYRRYEESPDDEK